MDGLKARLSFDAVAYDYDDEYLTIDTDTHTININNVSRLFGVQYDGNSKLIKFRISNKLSDIQKMQDSIVYINWIDQKGVKGQSIAIDKTIRNDTCEFAWKVPFDALKNSGVLHFAMSAVVTKNSSSVIDKRWSTRIASVITPDGIYIKSYTPSSEEEDRIAQIYNELSNMINKQSENLQSQISSLKEGLVNQKKEIDNSKKAISELADKKITKFYASNQGETHIADSDKGLIQDLKIYGQSKQDGEPSPSNPVEIKNVVNPMIKVVGKNLIEFDESFKTDGFGITMTYEKGGIRMIGTATINGNLRVINPDIKKIKWNNNKYTVSLKVEGEYNGEMYISEAKDEQWATITAVSANRTSTFDKAINVVGIFITFSKGEKYNVLLYPQVEYGSQATEYEPYKEQSVTLPITLNAIPVSSGGNVTINGQQYISDYIDVERGKLVKKVSKISVKGSNNKSNWRVTNQSKFEYAIDIFEKVHNYLEGLCENYIVENKRFVDKSIIIGISGLQIFVCDSSLKSLNDVVSSFNSKPLVVYYPSDEISEIELTSEQIQALKALHANYPATNIFLTSEQLDGNAVFNYPISLANGWNYVKQQLNDNRDYIYDMDLQSAEAYVNSEYAVTLTELEV